jgi:hypothetical protein
MLNLKLDNGGPVSDVVKDVLKQWRRVHVSQFPIEVEAHPTRPCVRFVDSRFPTDSWRRERLLGFLDISTDAKGRPMYKLYSNLIENEKYNCHNDEYHAKSTTDPKKLLVLLKEFVKPYTPHEIVNRIGDPVLLDREEWRDEPKREYREMARRLDVKDILDEVAYLQSVGVQFRSPGFQKLAVEGIRAYEESKRRESIPTVHVHVFIQPDDSVLLTKGKGDYTVHENMDRVPECVQQQVAMLRMMEAGQYLPEVGKKCHDTRAFWVHVNPDDLNTSNT